MILKSEDLTIPQLDNGPINPIIIILEIIGSLLVIGLAVFIILKCKKKNI